MLTFDEHKLNADKYGHFQDVCLTSHNARCLFLRSSEQRQSKKDYNKECLITVETVVSG